VVWWICRFFDPQFRPAGLWSFFLAATEFGAITVALVLTPALLAGALTGEKARGTMLLLLSSQVTSREIVASRFIGRLCAIGVVTLAALPLLAVLAGANSVPPGRLLVLVGLPASVALGVGGLAMAASAVTSRGRDALMGVYLTVVALLVGPGLFVGLLPEAATGWIVSANPYSGLFRLSWAGEVGAALRTMALWTALGTLGIFCAVVRLRPSYLKNLEGHRSRRAARRRRGFSFVKRRLPEMKQRPMIWKELYVEQITALNPLVRWIGLLLVAVLLGGSLLLGSLVVWSRWIQPSEAAEIRAGTQRLADWVIYSALPVSCLIQWAIGLRAAATIASERERATWDALLTSPLDGREIVGGKIAGSLYALRWLIISAAVAWTLPVVLGAITPADYAGLVIGALTATAFAATVGVWCSLTSEGADGAMTKTLAIWLLASVVMLAVGAAMAGILAGVYTAIWKLGVNRFGGSLTVWYPMSYQAALMICVDGLYALGTFVGVLYLRRRFDALAGRSPADHLIAVRVDSRPPVREPSDNLTDIAAANIAAADIADAIVVEPPGSIPPRRRARGAAGDRPRHEGSDRARDFWDRP
jgi:ABC-type transport system involved in multi-copper enzyme maturation permease subunit